MWFGKINGVVYVVGVINDGLMLVKFLVDVVDVMVLKLYGILVLD